MDSFMDVTEQKQLNEAREAHIPGRNGAPTSASASGGRSGKTTQRQRQCVGLFLP